MTTTDPSKVKFHISETFLSLEGEGPFIGRPMLFLRFYGCNLTCPGFGGGTPTYNPANSLETLEVSSIGCDSAYAWHPKYKNLRRTLTLDQLHEEIVGKLPNGKWHYEHNYGGRQNIYDDNVVLCLTGGEPLMHQTSIKHMFEDPRFQQGLEVSYLAAQILRYALVQSFLTLVKRTSAVLC
jgi:organic radical activating enzyme